MTARWKRPEHPGGRTRSLRIRLAESERDELFGLAAAQGVSVARYVLTIVLTGETPRERLEARSELLAVRKAMVRAGANINQATIRAHVEGDVSRLVGMAGELDAALARHDAMLGRLR
jgi:hypothetical protein